MHVNIDTIELSAKIQCVVSSFTSEVEICKDYNRYHAIDDTYETHNSRYAQEQPSGSTKFIRDENRFFLEFSESDLERYLESAHHVDPAKSEISNHPIFYARRHGYVSMDFLLPDNKEHARCPIELIEEGGKLD